MKKHNIIIDGSNLIHRVYWVSNKTNTNTVHMFMNSIKKIYNDWDPTQMFIVWDSRLIRGEKNFRRLNEDYKSTRDKDSWKSVYEHEDVMKEFCNSVGVGNLFPGVLEADDVIYYMCKKLDGYKTVISSDHDMLQLVDNLTCIHNPVSKFTYNINNFETKLNVPVDRYIHYKALVGDKSDNIQGIKGVGHKTAVKYIKQGIKESLNGDDYKIYEQNLRLVDLSVGVQEHPGEIEIYQDQLSSLEKFKSDYNTFKDICTNVKYPQKSMDKFSIFFPDDLNTRLIEILS